MINKTINLEFLIGYIMVYSKCYSVHLVWFEIFECCVTRAMVHTFAHAHRSQPDSISRRGQCGGDDYRQPLALVQYGGILTFVQLLPTVPPIWASDPAWS